MTMIHVTIPSTFFFNPTATTEIYTLSLHDALPISQHAPRAFRGEQDEQRLRRRHQDVRRMFTHLLALPGDRKSTRLNSSHVAISYAVFCLKKKRSPEPMENPTLALRLSLSGAERRF